MFGRLLRVTGTVLVIAAAIVIPGLATAAPAGADTVVDGCNIVSNPTPTNFTNCPGADLSGADLSGVDLDFANLAGAQFVYATCNPYGFPFPICTSTVADLSGTSFSGANLSSANMAGTDLSGDSLTGADLSGTVLGSSDQYANMTGANLTDAFFGSSSDLTGANFTDATLTGAELDYTTLTGANFTDAVLTGVAFTGTLLVPSAQSAFATSDAGAAVTWPTPSSLPGATPGTCTPPSGSTFPLGQNGNQGYTTVTCQVLDDFGNAATGTFEVTVSTVPVSISVSSSSSLSVVGQSVNYTVTVSSIVPGTVSPTGGTVYFGDNDNFSPIAGCTAVPLSDGSATCTTSPATTGAHNIIVGYVGGPVFGTSQDGDPLTQFVTEHPCKTLADCNLSGLNLSGANFGNAYEEQGNFQFVGADLEGTNLAGADLSHAYLNGANLEGDTLAGANLSGANLNDTNLKGANLKGVNLTGADLNTTFSNTTCPDGTNSNDDGGNCFNDLSVNAS